MPQTITKIFNHQQIRAAFDRQSEKWFFAIVDIIAVLTESDNPQVYWRVMKKRLTDEGNETVTNCNGLKMKSADGKMRLIDVADMEQLLRLIQSIPSKKAEPLKLWLAQVGRERIDEEYDPEITINRALATYRRQGYSEGWIAQRLKSIEIRKEFTDELQHRGINSNRDFAILTNILTQTWSGFTVRQYKEHKGLTKHNLRDHMTNLELILTQLAEVSATEFSQNEKPQNYPAIKSTVVAGANVAKQARENIEKRTGRTAISPQNHLGQQRQI